MKTLNLAILMAFGLSVPFAAMSSDDDEIHKHAMQMHEKSQESVMKRVQIPDAASDKATDSATYRYRKTERKLKSDSQGKGSAYSGEQTPGNKHAGKQSSDNKYGAGAAKGTKKQTAKGDKKQTGSATGESVGVLDRDRIQDQDQLMIRDLYQDRMMDQDQDRTMAMDQDQIRDTDHVFDQEPAMEQNVVPEPPMKHEQNEIENVTKR